MVNCLKNQLIQPHSLGILKGDLHNLEHISETLDTYTNGSVSIVRPSSLFYWVVVVIYNVV